ncbi:transglycosylase SLT domain-containing protein [Roseibium sp.]|uniref:transglycosylase SLT domain-containing protein n=1 Tax=Roseibium sp. TaxID=1936156 RepID=UPI003D0B716C
MAHFIRLALLVLLSVTGVTAQETGDVLIEEVHREFKGDYDGMKKDKVVRALISYSLVDYYVDQGREMGFAVEYLRVFEKFLNKDIKREADKVRIVLIPTRRDVLLSDLTAGKGDIAVANLTITDERKKLVDFSIPLHSGVAERIVTRKDHETLKDLSDLSGMEVHVRKSSSYFESLEAANKKLKTDGLEPIKITAMSEWLEDEDLMEMVSAGAIEATVIDDYAGQLWQQFFDNVTLQEAPLIRTEGEIAWAFRKDSPLLEAQVNAFLEKNKIGTKLGNILGRRYYSDIDRLINPKSEAYLKRLDELMVHFKAAGEKYGIDPVLLAAQAFQESRFNHKAKSRAGAVGIMQVLPSTARDKSVGIKNFRELEGNIEAGAKYNRFVADTYFDDPEIPDLQQILFVFASYNAGPNRVARLRKKASDPNLWFESVEWQVAKSVGAEPVKYVKNIYIYYVLFNEILKYEDAKPKQENDG